MSSVQTRTIRQDYTEILATRATANDGTALAAAAGSGWKWRVEDIAFFLTDPTTTVTCVLKVGTKTFPSVTLNSSRTGFGLAWEAGNGWDGTDDGAIYLNLSGNVSVGVLGRVVKVKA
jgi:hypothetical protein